MVFSKLLWRLCLKWLSKIQDFYLVEINDHWHFGPIPMWEIQVAIWSLFTIVWEQRRVWCFNNRWIVSKVLGRHSMGSNVTGFISRHFRNWSRPFLVKACYIEKFGKSMLYWETTCFYHFTFQWYELSVI